MLTEVVLTHPCDTNVHLLAGAWTTARGRPITHCPTAASGSDRPSSRSSRSSYAELGLMLAPVQSRDRKDRLCQLHEDRHSNAVSSSGRAQLRRCRLKSLAAPRCVRSWEVSSYLPPVCPPSSAQVYVGR